MRSRAGVVPRLGLALLLAFSGAGSPGHADEAAESALAACTARAAESPETWDVYCFTRVATEHHAREEANRRVRSLLRRGESPHLRFVLGVLEMNGGDLAEAGEQLRASADGFATRGDPGNEALVLTNLARSEARRDRLQEAAEILERARALARSADDLAVLVDATVQGIQMDRRLGGDLERADRALRELEAEIPEDAGYRVRQTLLHERASVLHELGRYDQAYRYNLRRADEAREADELDDVATALANGVVNLVAMPLTTDSRERAIRFAREALAVAEATSNRQASVLAHRELGKLLRGDPARRHLETCLRITSESGNTSRHVDCLFALAGSLAAREPDRARSLHDQALELAVSSEDPWLEINGWAERFRVLWATRPRAEAAAESLALLDRIEALRRRQASETGRAWFFTHWTEVYLALVGYLLDAPGGPTRDEIETAFAVSERLRARVLLDGLVAGVDVPEELPFVDLPRVEAALEPHQALLLFTSAPDLDIYRKFAGGSWLMAVTADGTRIHRLPDRVELDFRLKMVLGLVAGENDSDLEFGTARLYEDLLAGALEELPPSVRELVIVPDGALHELPFGILRDHPQSDPLIVTHRLSTVPSATLWHRWRSAPRTATSAALALANPTLLPAGPEERAPSRPPVSMGDDPRRSLRSRASLPDLPRAADEGRTVVRRFGGPPSRVWIGARASEAALKTARLEDFGVLHFAAHGVLDRASPGRSAIMLAPGGPGEDGDLQAQEIAALDLTDKLVILSACETASGQILSGEGMQSLVRAFFRAGTRTVVASRWRIEDGDAAELFDRFYRELARGESVSGAVAEAQRAMRRSGAPVRAWAGIETFGDGDLVPRGGGADRTDPIVWAALLAALAAALGLRLWASRPSTGSAS